MCVCVVTDDDHIIQLVSKFTDNNNKFLNLTTFNS